MAKNKKNSDLIVFLVLCLVAIYFVRGALMLDPDFGWRLRTGFFILKNGVPKTDLYSYTMASFPWVDHAWLTDVMMSLMYKVIGNVGLTIVFSAIAISSLFVSVWGKKVDKNWLDFWWRVKLNQQDLWYFGAPVFLLSVASLLPFFGIRAQVTTWLFFAVFLKVIFDQRQWNKYRFLTPLYFLAWANFHGGFVAGLGVFWTVIVVQSVWSKKIEKWDFLILLLTTACTFLNPYGWGVYREVWSSVSDSSLRFEIMEWQPAFMSFDAPSLILIALSAIFVFFYRKKFTPERVVVFFIIFFEGISSVRHFPLFVLIAMPMTIEAINYFYDENKKSKLSRKRFAEVYSYLWIFAFLALLIQTLTSYKEAVSLTEDAFYPKDAVFYMSNNLPSGKIFSDYTWGGYLIWKLPQKKVFIDGRMPSWNWKANPENESGNVMKEYLDLIKGKNEYKSIFKKYGITTVLWSPNRTENIFDHLENQFGDKLGFFYKLLHIDRTHFFLPEKLEQDGWHQVYKDDMSVIYVEPNNKKTKE